MRKNKRREVFPYLNGLLMVVLGAIFVIPFWMMLTASFSDNTRLMANGISVWFQGFSFEGYVFLFQMSDIFARAILNSVIVSLASSVLSVVLCTSAAYVLSKKDLVGRKILNIVFMIPMFFGGGMIPTFLVIRGIGIYNTLWSLILPGSLAVANVLLIRNYFYGIPHSLYEASELDGANQLQILTKVYIPLAVPIMMTVGMSTFVAKWNSWIDVLLYFGASNKEWWTVQYVLRQILTDMQALFGGSNGGSIIGAPLISARNAAIVVAVTPLIAIMPILHKYYIKGMTQGAVKG